MANRSLFGRPMTSAERSRRSRTGKVPFDRENWETMKKNELNDILRSEFSDNWKCVRALQWAETVLKHTREF